MLVKPGARVVAGQPIAIIEQKLLITQIENALAEVERLEANLALLKAANAAQIASSDEAARRQLAAIDEQLAANEVRRDRLRELVAAYSALRCRGMISQNELIARQEQYDLTLLDLANAKARRVEIELAAADEARRPGRRRTPEAGGDRSQEGGRRSAAGGDGGRIDRQVADQRRHP